MLKSSESVLCLFYHFLESAQWRIFMTLEFCTMAKSHIGEHTIRQLCAGNAAQTEIRYLGLRKGKHFK